MQTQREGVGCFLQFNKSSCSFLLKVMTSLKESQYICSILTSSINTNTIDLMLDVLNNLVSWYDSLILNKDGGGVSAQSQSQLSIVMFLHILLASNI